MSNEQQKAQELFGRLVQLTEAEQLAVLDEVCGDDAALRQQVQALLEGEVQAKSEAFLATGEFQSPSEAVSHNQSAESQQATADYQGPATTEILLGDRYILQRKIGEGGMGEVWIAKQTEPVKRQVAIKLIKAGMDSQAVLARFEQERQALAIMDHPSIARVLDGGITAAGRPFFVMELVHGLPLNKFCDDAKLDLKERLELFVPICQAIQHAHQKGIVHRDLKPANILVSMVDGRPVPKVIDFGVAKATAGRLTDQSMSTQFGAIVGTLEYMAPEQAGYSGADVDTRADIYSLGVTLYELLTGLRPIDASRLESAAYSEMIRIIQEEEPSKPSTRISTSDSLPSVAAVRKIHPHKLKSLLRGELDWVVMKCLEKTRDRRYETANALARDIQRYLANETVEARPPSSVYRFQKFMRRNTGGVIAAGLILAALMVGVIGTGLGLLRARRAEANAVEKANEADLARLEAVKANQALQESIQRETDRFDLARQAIEVYHGEISKDLLLKESKFQSLRTRLLEGAADFYDQLEALLIEQSDAKSRVMLGQSYHDLGKLTSDIGDKQRALEVQLKGLAVNRANAIRPDANQMEQLAVIRSLGQVAKLQLALGELESAEKNYLEGVFIGESLSAAGADSDELLGSLGTLCNELGMLYSSNQPDRAVEWYTKGSDWLQAVVDRSPDFEQAQRELAYCRNNIGAVWTRTGKPQEALEEFQACLETRKKLADKHPDQIEIKRDLGVAYGNLAYAFVLLGKSEESLEATRKSMEIRQALFDANPAISEFQTDLAGCHDSMGHYYLEVGDAVKAKDAFAKAAEIQRLAVEGNPNVVEFRGTLARYYNNTGAALSRTDMSAAVEQFKNALSVQQEIAERFPALARYQSELAQSFQNIGLAMRYDDDFDGAVRQYRRAIEVLEKLSSDSPSVPEYKADICKNLQNMAVIKNLSESYDEAIELLSQAIDIQELLCEQNPENNPYARELRAATIQDRSPTSKRANSI